MFENLIAALSASPGHAIAALAAFAAGIVRGFSGFGTAMIYTPAAAAALSPVFAICSLVVMDTLPSLPLLIKAVRDTQWRTILTLIATATLTVPVGAYVLKVLDPIVLRWFICGLIFVVVAVLWSGWRMTRPPRRHETMGIGALSGFLAGSAALAGPPVILFYLSGQADAKAVRANMIVFLAAMTVVTITALTLNGLFTLNAALWGVTLMIPYGVGLLIGVRFFGKTSEETFRQVAFVVILFSAVASLPIFDAVFR